MPMTLLAQAVSNTFLIDPVKPVLLTITALAGAALASRLVKDIHPRFNELLRDDKTFPYLAVTVRDEFPGVYVTRNPSDPRFEGARVFGPFTSVHALRTSVTLLQRVFQYRTCELDIKADDPANRRFRPCLLHSIGQCTAPCANRVTVSRYRADVDRFLRFLGSRRSVLVRELQGEMERASAERRFEDAAALRDQIHALKARGLKKGLATLCIGGGEGTAVALELV